VTTDFNYPTKSLSVFIYPVPVPRYRVTASLIVAMDIIVVGAGIAGLSAGIALRKAGHKVTVKITHHNGNAHY
jgi:NADPH-dependent 2,4-dienoyl-CoA reductase/sulfur reductase-like enzyme